MNSKCTHTFRSALIMLALVACVSFSSFKNPPERRETAFKTIFKDSIPIEVELIYGKDNLPDSYFSRIKTPVCEDSLCYLVLIDIYWDLLGNFQHYETPKKDPLTKFDHIEFTKADHQKMKAILANRESALRDYAVENLLDPNKKKNSEVVVDAVSSATNVAVKDEVVEGALYSTYTIWHIVNGEIAKKIAAHSKPLINEKVLQKMLASDNPHYQYEVLKRISEPDFNRYARQVIRLVTEGSSYVPYFAIEKIPASIWADAAYQESLVEVIGKAEFQMQNEVINKLKGVQLSQQALDVLIGHMRNLNEDQQEKVLAIAGRNKSVLSAKSASILSKLNTNPNP